VIEKGQEGFATYMQIHTLVFPDLDQETEQDTDIDREELEEEEPKARVLIHNDEVTPYDFVVIILQRIFELTPLEAEHVTFVAHTSGVAYVTTLPLSEAQKRVGKAKFAASLEGYPLQFTIEPE
jgi:ATP-dependent Clp protease adaptor protein ClpS